MPSAKLPLSIRIDPAIIDKARIKAEMQNRNLANYVETLIVNDTKDDVVKERMVKRRVVVPRTAGVE